jgi:hypothetical protein
MNLFFKCNKLIALKSGGRPSFSEEKEAKRLLFPEAFDPDRDESHRNQKFFASFFQKRSAS